MKPVEEMFPLALKAVEKHIAEKDNFNNKNGIDLIVKKVYNGYISSFGAAIIQSGILPAIANLEKTTQNTEGDKKNIAKALLYILTDLKKYSPYKESNSLLEMALKLRNDKSFQSDLKNAVIALKLSIRMFKLEEGDKK
jgi:CRISPR-associated protein Cmr5